MALLLEFYRPEHLPRLFEYWKCLGAEIPYFFPVTQERWETCLFADRLDGEVIFKRLETYLAFDAGQLVGFIQFGQPNFAWDERGERFPDPEIGVIRHLFFERESPRAGQALLAKAEGFLKCFPRNHAFYHIMGMSCNAHHGKLHESQSHVGALLLENGFQVEHENLYYVLDLEAWQVVEQNSGSLSGQQKGAELDVSLVSSTLGLEWYEAKFGGELVGSAGVRLLEPGTAGMPKTAYLTWIGMETSQQGRGFGSVFLRTIADRLKMQGYRFLHTDTASTNLPAQRFYEKFGFSNLGKTRSYIRDGVSPPR